jgi:hypothetical protein
LKQTLNHAENVVRHPLRLTTGPEHFPCRCEGPNGWCIKERLSRKTRSAAVGGRASKQATGTGSSSTPLLLCKSSCHPSSRRKATQMQRKRKAHLNLTPVFLGRPHLQPPTPTPSPYRPAKAVCRSEQKSNGLHRRQCTFPPGTLPPIQQKSCEQISRKRR